MKTLEAVDSRNAAATPVLVDIANYHYYDRVAGVNALNSYGREVGWYSSLTAGELAVAMVNPADADQLAEGDGINIDEFMPEDQEKIRDYYEKILAISLRQARGEDDGN